MSCPQLDACLVSFCLLSIPHPSSLLTRELDHQATPVLSPPPVEAQRGFFWLVWSHFSNDTAVAVAPSPDMHVPLGNETDFVWLMQVLLRIL